MFVRTVQSVTCYFLECIFFIWLDIIGFFVLEMRLQININGAQSKLSESQKEMDFGNNYIIYFFSISLLLNTMK